MIPPCFLEQVFKTGHVFVDCIGPHSIISQFTIYLLLRSSIHKGAMKLSTEFHPQLLIIDMMGRGYTIEDITVTLDIELFGLLQDPIINHWSSYKGKCKCSPGVSNIYNPCFLINYMVQGKFLGELFHILLVSIKNERSSPL
jgi:hypothetical protein